MPKHLQVTIWTLNDDEVMYPWNIFQRMNEWYLGGGFNPFEKY